MRKPRKSPAPSLILTPSECHNIFAAALQRALAMEAEKADLIEILVPLEP